MVLQATRGRHQHINAAPKRLALATKADTAENGRDGKAEMLAIGAEAFGDLRRQFAGRAQHQHAAATARRAALQQSKLMQQGQRKGRGLAGTGLGNAQKVAPFKHGRNGLGLDGGWGFVALILQSLKEKGIEAQRLKCIGHDESLISRAQPSGPSVAWGRKPRGIGTVLSGKSDLADPGPHRASREAAGTDHAAGRARGAREHALTGCIWAPKGAKARRPPLSFQADI